MNNSIEFTSEEMEVIVMQTNELSFAERLEQSVNSKGFEYDVYGVSKQYDWKRESNQKRIVR